MRGVEYLSQLPQWSAGAFSPIEVPQRILSLLGNPQDKVKTIHVAGTNGKGTCCAAISAILEQAGFKVGFFSSPHLVEVNERCRINSKPLALEKFDYYLCKVAEVAAWDCNAMTYFVATAAASFLFFAEEQVDYAVIEVGLGGKYDATNLISRPEVSVITTVDYDHADVLGKTLTQIAENKAGIIKQGVPVVIGELSAAVYKVVIDIAREKNADLYQTLPIEIAKSVLGRSVVGKSACGIALKVAEILKIADEVSSNALENLYWPGRMELISLSGGQSVLIDGAHNSAGMRALFLDLEQIIKIKDFKEVTVFLGLKQRDGWEITMKTAISGIEHLREAGFPVKLYMIDWKQGVKVENSQEIDLPSAVKLIMSTQDDGLNVVTGSLYLVGEFLASLR